MPSSPNYKRDYRQEYDAYQGTTTQKKNRVKRNTSRRQAASAGLVSKGDGKEIDHKVPLSKGGSNSKSNRRVLTESNNRSFPRNKDGSMK